MGDSHKPFSITQKVWATLHRVSTTNFSMDCELTLTRQDGKSGVYAMKGIFKGESAMSSYDRVEIGQKIVEKVQVDEMSECRETGQCRTKQRRIAA